MLSDQLFTLGAGSALYDASIGFSGPALQFSLVSAPAGVTIDTATGVIDFSAAGPVTDGLVTLRAQNLEGLGTEASFRVDIVETEITAVTTPALSALYDGQSLQDAPGYAAMTAPGNFASSAGSIVSVEVAATHEAADVETPLAEGEAAGFIVTVTDSLGTVSEFTAGPALVEYKARIVATLDNEAEIEINPTLPDTETVSLTITGTDGYDGTYAEISVGALRNGPHALVRPSISYSDLIEGATLTGDDGLWTSPTGDLSLSRQWLRDGVPIADATTLAHTLVQGDTGAEIALRITADDGLNTPVATPSTGVHVPAVSAGEPPALIGTGFETGAGVTTHDLSGLSEGDEIYIAIALRSNASGNTIADVAYNGIPATRVTASDGSGGRISTAIYRVTKGTETSAEIAVTSSGGLTDTLSALYRANGWGSVNGASSADSSDALQTVGIDVAGPGGVIAIAADQGGGTSLEFSAGGLIQDDALALYSNENFIVGAMTTSSAETGRTYTASAVSGTPAMAISVASLG